MTVIHMTNLDLSNKRVLIRSDLNVPMRNGQIISDIRIRSSLPTIKAALKQGARVMVASHFGRPKEGEYNTAFSLQPIVDYLKNKFSLQVKLVKNYLHGVEISEGEIVILENVRFNKGEEKNDDTLAQKYASLCDVFVMDAFGTAHRTHASTHGVSKFAHIACAGLLLSSELKALKKILNAPNLPMVAIVGGSKISTKLTVLRFLAQIANQIIVGGGIANTFIAAQGYNVGKSIYEPQLLTEAYDLLKINNIIVPTDVLVAQEFSETASATLKSTHNIQNYEYILDLGNLAITRVKAILKNARTILWNGPVGVFEFTNFRKGTEAIAHAIINSKAFSVAGGGDTLAAINLFDIADQISYISTGGGAFLKFLEGKNLPAVVMLEKRAQH